jgi:sec-independent protein translocase protein TatA
MIGDMELLLVFIVALILFGPEKVPELARQLGETIAEIRESLHGKELKG